MMTPPPPPLPVLLRIEKTKGFFGKKFFPSHSSFFFSKNEKRDGSVQ
jgi:hypothetical protein